MNYDLNSFEALIAAAPDGDEPPAPSLATPLRKGPPAMSSLEIAAITGKNHADVMRDIRNVLEQAEIDQSKFESIFLDSYKREQPCYILPRRECDLVVSGYSVRYRLAIIDRWQELEGRQDLAKALSDPETLRNLLLDNVEQVLALKKENAELAPKAAGLDRIANSVGSMTITAAAKALGQSPKRLFETMHSSGWIYRRGGDLLPMQTRLNSGDMVCKAITFPVAGEADRTTTQARVTPKGLARLATLFPKP